MACITALIPSPSPPFIPHITAYVANQYDPTRTTALRNAFARDMDARFVALAKLIRRAVVDEDCFALMPASGGFAVAGYASMVTPGRHAFDFPRSGDKVAAFMQWLAKQESAGILEITHAVQLGEAVEQAWTNKYVQSAYQRGIARARQELIAETAVKRLSIREIRKCVADAMKKDHPSWQDMEIAREIAMAEAGISDQYSGMMAGMRSASSRGRVVPSIEQSGGIHAAFNQPFHLDRVGLIYQRAYSDLKGITTAMDAQISRVLAQAMADGRGPIEIARLLTRTINGPVGDLGITDVLGRFIPARRRAEMLARTEVIRAHHVATIQEYRNWGVVGVKVKAEWKTTEDAKVCDRCAALDGKVFTLDEIEGRIPAHPYCRCCALPSEIPEEEKPAVSYAPAMTMPTEQDLLTFEEANLKYENMLKQAGGSSYAEDVKAHVAERLAARMAASVDKADYDYFINTFPVLRLHPSDVERQLVARWARTSADEDHLALFMQQMAKKEFNLTHSATDHFSEQVLTDLKKYLADYDVVRVERGARAFLRGMYNETQAVFKEAGVTEMLVFRGTRFGPVTIPAELKGTVSEKFGMSVGKLGSQPMSSYSSDFYTALSFSQGDKYGVVTVTKVPVTRIIGTPASGYGCLDESEMVIFGSRDEVLLVYKSVVEWPPDVIGKLVKLTKGVK